MAKNNEQVCFRTTIGGQALIEGILMRGPDKQAIVCRTAEGMTEKVEPLKLVKDRHPALGWPFIRGLVIFVDSMVKGMRALTYSASLLPEDEQEEPTKFDLWLEKKLGSEKAEKIVIGIAAVLGVLLAVGLFLFLPTFIAGLIPGVDGHYTLRSLLEGALKIVIFLVYLGLIARMKDMKRLFSYHGAEHKTIFCYERGLDLTVENARAMPRHHPRCGTSFLFVVIAVAILASCVVFALPGVRDVATNPLVRILLHLALVPVVVGVTYEINHFVGAHDNWFTKILAAPGLWMQNFTTFEPDDSMLEVAIHALKLVLPQEKGADAW